MKVEISGVVEEVGAHLIDGKEFSYFDLKQPGDQFRPGEIVRISGSSNGYSRGDSVQVKAELRLEKGKLKIRQLKEESF